MAGLIAFFTALPAFVELIGKLAEVMLRFLDYAHKNNINAWIDNLEQSIDRLEKAKTPDDKLSAAQSLVGSIRNLGQ